MKRFYDSLKCLYEPSTSDSPPMFGADGETLITDKKEIVERWVQHISDVVNRPTSINDEAIQRFPQVDMNPDLDVPPCEDEVTKAIKQMSSAKTPDPDAIPAEVFKSGGPSLLQKLTALFQSSLESEALPQEFKDATIVHIYKRKGNKRSCHNHRGISLLSIAGKIMARILLNRLLSTSRKVTSLRASAVSAQVAEPLIWCLPLVRSRGRVWTNIKTSILLLLTS